MAHLVYENLLGRAKRLRRASKMGFKILTYQKYVHLPAHNPTLYGLKVTFLQGYTEVEPLSNWVTRIFALACLVLLHTIVSGPLPALPEVQSAVARSIVALQSRPKHYSLTGSVWALCVIGCMAQPHVRPFFENLMAELVRGAGRCGNSETVWKIITKCWEMQETARVDSRATMAEMGIHAILI